MKTRFISLGLLALVLLTPHLSANWNRELQSKIHEKSYQPWMLQQVNSDFEPFYISGIPTSLLDKMLAENGPGNPYLLVRYEIRNRRVFVKYAENLANELRFQTVTAALRLLAHFAPLPHMDFIVSMHDSCSYVGNSDTFKGPILAFAKNVHADRFTILIPDFEALIGHESVLNEVTQANLDYPWQNKRPMMIWRGATTGGIFNLENFKTSSRAKLVETSLKYPQYVDARFTSFVQMDEPTKSAMLALGYKGSSVSVGSHLAYKYQMLVDGNSCAYSRAIWGLFSNSVVFKQASPHIQWYYGALQPYVHYIPVASDCSDLIEKIQWAKDHDDEAQAIVKNANVFAHTNLKHSDTMLYLYLVLSEYARVQRL